MDVPGSNSGKFFFDTAELGESSKTLDFDSEI